VRWPERIPAGTLSTEVMSTLDLMPTFLAAAGSAASSDRHVDGMNLLPAWLDRGKVPERTLFWEWRSEGGNQLAALRGKDKLVISGGSKGELFDVDADPAERRNVAALFPDVYQELNDQL
jgi:arylsulfatase A-like enzyme